MVFRFSRGTGLMMCVAAALIGLTARLADAAEAGPFELTVEFLNSARSWVRQPPQVRFGGSLVVRAQWPTPYTEKDDVSYVVWITSPAAAWASVTTLEGAGGRQDVVLGRIRDGGRTRAGWKMCFGRRPPGAAGDAAPVAPLPPGRYAFTVHVERARAGAAPERASAVFPIEIVGDGDAPVVAGLSDHQVFRRTSKTAGEVAFEVVTSDEDPAARARVRAADGEVVADATGTTGPAGHAFRLANVPVGGPYTVELTAAGHTLTYENVYVGDLWVIGGQSNAVGVGHDRELGRKAVPGVHVLDPKQNRHEWQPAADGLFEHTVGPWVTAAQDFHAATGVPVGLIGHAVGARPMGYFLDVERKEMTFLKPLVERHGRGATAFFWYQGESDCFHPAQSQSYGRKLDVMADAMRRHTDNPQLMIGVVQLARYLWQKDDHFAVVREAQRQFVLHDPAAVLYATLPYGVNEKDKIHLTTEGYVELGRQIARQMIERERTGVLRSPGPALRAATFAGTDRRRVVLTFESSGDLRGGDAADQWYVTDATRRGFRDGGFVGVSRVTVDAERRQVVLELADPARGAAAVSYGYRSDVGGTLADADANPAAAFVRVPVVEK